ncbi:MAG: hypothetical protein ACRDKJ_01950 [Actinomycetota bacterium]
MNPWREPLVGAKVRRMDALSRRPSIDVVFAGSSQMLFAGDPVMLRRNLGVRWSSYNAALWGAPPVVNEHWLLDVVQPRLRPKVVVLGVSPVDFVEADTDVPVRNYFNAPAVRDDWIGSVERAASSRFSLVRHRRSLRSYSALFDSIGRRRRGEAGPRVFGAGIDAFGRMRSRDNDRFRGDDAARAVVAGVVERGWEPSEVQRDAFVRTVRGLVARGIEPIVMEMAVSGPFIDLLGGSQAYSSFRSFLSKETDALGVTLLDAAGGASDTRFFIDFDHVNRDGANVFNSIVGRLFGAATPGSFSAHVDPQLGASSLAPALAADVVEKAPRAGVPQAGPASPEPAVVPPSRVPPIVRIHPAPSA